MILPCLPERQSRGPTLRWPRRLGRDLPHQAVPLPLHARLDGAYASRVAVRLGPPLPPHPRRR